MFSAAQSSSLSSQFMRLSGILGPGVLLGLPELPPCKVGYIMAMIGSFVEYLSTSNAMSQFLGLLIDDSTKSSKEQYLRER